MIIKHQFTGADRGFLLGETFNDDHINIVRSEERLGRRLDEVLDGIAVGLFHSECGPLHLPELIDHVGGEVADRVGFHPTGIGHIRRKLIDSHTISKSNVSSISLEVAPR